jgi:hypothetical protein
MKSYRSPRSAAVLAGAIMALSVAVPAGAATKPSYTPLVGDKFQSVYFSSWHAKGASRLGFKAYFLSRGTPAGYVGPTGQWDRRR